MYEKLEALQYVYKCALKQTRFIFSSCFCRTIGTGRQLQPGEDMLEEEEEEGLDENDGPSPSEEDGTERKWTDTGTATRAGVTLKTQTGE